MCFGSSMAAGKRNMSLDEDEEKTAARTAQTIEFLPVEHPKKKSKKTPGKKQHCIVDHRLIYSDDIGNKHTEAEECDKLEHVAINFSVTRNGIFNILFASVFGVADLIGAKDLALCIMPFLMHRGETANGNAYGEIVSELQEWIDDIPGFDFEQRRMMAMYLARYEKYPRFFELLENAQRTAYDLDGRVPEWMVDEIKWASCDEECSECEFVDECDFGNCVCPVGYDTYRDGLGYND
jgi:hypothetical protein